MVDTWHEAARYREIDPHPLLRSHVECFWIANGPAAEFVVMPDGCVDFLFDAAAPGRGARLVGAMTKPFAVPASAGRDIVAVRFRPGGAHTFVRAPLHEFTDDSVELVAIARDLGDLGRVVACEPERGERLRRIEQWLLARLPQRSDPILGALGAVAAPDGAAFRVDAAAASAGVSRQFFTRAVRQRTGLPPKVLARILRVRRVVNDPTGAPAVTLAQRHGFADQAHLAREVREITGRTMTCWRT